MIEIVPPINRLRLDFLLVQLLCWKAKAETAGCAYEPLHLNCNGQISRTAATETQTQGV